MVNVEENQYFHILLTNDQQLLALQLISHKNMRSSRYMFGVLPESMRYTMHLICRVTMNIYVLFAAELPPEMKKCFTQLIMKKFVRQIQMAPLRTYLKKT